MEPIPDCHAASSSGRPPADSGNPIFLLSKKEQNRIAQSNYRQRQKVLHPPPTPAPPSLHAHKGSSEACWPNVSLTCVIVQAVTRINQQELGRLNSVANAANAEAAEAKARMAQAQAEVHHLRTLVRVPSNGQCRSCTLTLAFHADQHPLQRRGTVGCASSH